LDGVATAAPYGAVAFADGINGASVTPAADNGATSHALPITATAQQLLGTAVGANLVALGALIALSGVVPPEAAEQAVAGRKPGGNAEAAVRALRAGFDLARAATADCGAQTAESAPR
jgi:Pyruvate/2-oxoacid:ferredoxin oxidoreductase gamma subunit